MVSMINSEKRRLLFIFSFKQVVFHQVLDSPDDQARWSPKCAEETEVFLWIFFSHKKYVTLQSSVMTSNRRHVVAHREIKYGLTLYDSLKENIYNMIGLYR